MWISLDVLDAALIIWCEFKVLILLRCFVHKRYHFTLSFHSILLSINGIKILYQNIVRATTTDDSTPGGMEVRYLLLMYNNNNNNVTGGANRIESNWNRIESKLIRNWVESVPNRHPIEIESNANRIGSNRTSWPGDFLFQFDSSHITMVWYNNNNNNNNNVTRGAQSNRFELK
jgi:hypothetical protein